MINHANRYSRQTILSEICISGQKKFAASEVVVIGCGATGSVHAETLARAGVGRLLLIDRDLVEPSNLQRQLLFSERDIGRPKAQAAADRLRRINSEIRIDFQITDIDSSNFETLIQGRTLVMDGTDNISTRMLINDACVKHNIPWVYAGVMQTSGMTMAIRPGGPCLQCVFPRADSFSSLPTCDQVGVLNTAVLATAAAACTLAFKILLGEDDTAGLLHLDVWLRTWEWLTVERDPHCACCGLGQYPFLGGGSDDRVLAFCGRNAVQVIPARALKPDFTRLAAELKKVGQVRHDEHLLVFSTAGMEATLFADGRAIVKGTEDTKIARSFYSRFFGC
ncbi:MAG: ThiF family adenylyltransferase [Candidatus Aminicenantes bacterium]|nr:ThiF family adenylyltransferase [Acidobacteriota bacterium]MBU4404633.1 ThiF family adenylyltransferase [Acidobacteriota bacterium]MCG2810233.1 ThiF family adenylyltransferase [Candidatus Aminicenantes bacterium]